MKKTFRTFYILILFILIPLSLNAQWMQTNGITNQTVNSLLVVNENLFAGTYTGAYISTNNGNSWSQTSLNNRVVFTFHLKNNIIFAGTEQGLYYSQDNGGNWNIVNFGIGTVLAMSSYQNFIFASSNYYGVCLSTDNGINWTPTTYINANIYSVYADSGFVFAGTANQGIYKSQNLGVNWLQSGLSTDWVVTFLKAGNYIYAGTIQNSKLCYTTNYGINWIQTSLIGGGGVHTILMNGSKLFSGVSNGVYMSTNNGVNWIHRNQGFNIVPGVFCLVNNNNYFFAGTQNQGVWRREISEITETKNFNSIVPEKFSLYQNYPNPFNPVTNIKYQISNTKFVSLKVFDVLGKEIETLVNEKQSAGTYEVNWDASQYPSGVYFYRLDANGFTNTKKMILLK